MKIGVFHPQLNIPLIDDIMEYVISGFVKHEPEAFIHRGHDYVPCDVAIRWGMHSLRFPGTTMYRNNIDQVHKGPIGVLELGWLKDRGKWFQFGFDGISGNAEYHIMNLYLSKWDIEKDEGIVIREQRKQTSGDYILLAGQVPWDTSVQHINYYDWVYNMIQAIDKVTDLPIVFRPHPKHRDAISMIPLTAKVEVIVSKGRTLEQDLFGARCVICYNSNTALEALIHGTPAITFNQGSMVYDITDHDLEKLDNPSFPDKYALIGQIKHILHCQWSAEGFEANTPWKIAKTVLDV